MDKIGGKRFDGPEPPGKVQRPSFHNLVHRLQPATLIDNRIGLPGDWDTPKDRLKSSFRGSSLRQHRGWAVTDLTDTH
jgi:hypothetical protein